MQLSAYSVPPLLAAVVLIGLGAASLRFRDAPAAPAFRALVFLAALWALAYALDTNSPTLADKLLWLKVRYLPIAALPVAGLALAVRFAQPAQPLTWRLMVPFSLVPILTAGLAWTTDAHNLFRYNFRLEEAGSLLVLRSDFGLWFWVSALYGYALALVGLVVMTRAYGAARPLYRRQVALIVASVAVPVLADSLFLAGITPLPGYNLAPASFSLTGLLLWLALFRYGVLEVRPLARDAVLASLADPVLVLDPRERLVDYNPAAAAILGLKAEAVIGRPAAEALPGYPWGLAPDPASAEVEAELPVDVAGQRRVYAVAATPVRHADGAQAGRLLRLRDVTERARMEAQLRENEARFRLMVDALPLPLVLTRLSDNTLLYLNPPAGELFGVAPADAVGRAAPSLYVRPEERAAFVALVQRDGGRRDWETEMQREDGSRFWVLLSATLTTYQGELVMLTGLNDITERRRIEQAERDQRQLAEALRDTAAALAATRNFEEVLEHLLANVGRVVPHEAVNVALVDEHGVAQVVRARGYAPEVTAAILGLRMPLAEAPFLRRMVESGQPMTVPDTWTEPGWIDYPGTRWVRSYVGMPIRSKGRVVGFLNLDSATPGFFAPAHVDALRAFADQAATAIENARLYDEVHRRADQLAVLNRISLAVTSGLELQHVLRALYEECRQLLPLDAFYIGVYDADSGLVEHLLFFDRGEFLPSHPRDIRERPGLSGEVILSRTTLYIPDTLAPENARAHPSVRSRGELTRSYVGAPLLVGDQVVGVISVQSYQPDAYTPDQIRLLETIAPQAALALENARLYEAARKELTERRQAEASLRQANERLQVQLATIEALQASLREQAIRDPLTGLFNRRYLQEALEQELARAARENHPVCLVMIDIDRFKRLNDEHGHAAGDGVLQALARLLETHTRRSDIVCRYGGEEILVVLPGLTADGAQRRAEEWRERFAGLSFESGGRRLAATFSAGLAAFPEHGRASEAVMAAADRALYLAKASGRNRVVVQA